MNALILAAGLGTRLGNLTAKVPKCLIPVGGTPILKIWIDKLLELNIDHIFINTHYLSNLVNNFIHDNYPKNEKIVICYEENLKGTAKTLIDLYKNIDVKPTLMIHADNYSSLNLKNFIQFFDAINPYSVMAKFKSQTPNECGVITDDDRGFIFSYKEKPKFPDNDTCNAAIYLLSVQFINYLLMNAPVNISDFSSEVLPNYFKFFRTYLISGFHIDIGTKKQLHRANRVADTFILQ